MRLPDFTAKSSLGKSKRTYYGRYQYGSLSQNPSGGGPAGVVPSQPEGMDVGDESSMMDEMGAEGMELGGMEGLGDEGETDVMDETEAEDIGMGEMTDDYEEA